MSTTTTLAPSIDMIGQWLLTALKGWRVSQLSLHDALGDSQWLSSGALGPDEHADVLEAYAAFALDRDCDIVKRRVNNCEQVFFPARDPLGAICGLAFAMVDGVGPDTSEAAPPAVLQLMRRYSMLLAPPVPKVPTSSSDTLTLHGATLTSSLASPPEVAAANAETDLVEFALDVAASKQALELEAIRYHRLRRGGNTRRFEVIYQARDVQQDLQVAASVINWLATRQPRSDSRPEQFTVPISTASARSAAFAAALYTLQERQPLVPGLFGLLLPAGAWRDEVALVEPLLKQCAGNNTLIGLDEYWPRDQSMEILRCKAVRLLKLDPLILKTAMAERFERAMLAAITQVARILGVHTAASGPHSDAARKWLAAAGVDFVDRIASAEQDPGATSTSLLRLAACS